MANNSNILIGKTLGTCRLEKLIGQGGMGVVYLAQQLRPVRYVAVKVLLPNLTADSQVYKEFLARFQREADVIARLEHINIMPVYEYGEQDGITYLVMPYLPGGSLRDKLAQQPVPPLRDTVNYISQAASALDYAHAQHVIHRDLKPANFLLHNDGRLVLADFGIARIMQENNNTAISTLTSTGMMLGTPEYMAPEMFTGNLVDYRSDIYALGIILYQLLSGQVPFRGNTFYSIATSHLQDAPPSLHTTQPALPLAIDNVIQIALAKRPEDRFNSAGALAQALRNTLSLTPEIDMLSLPTIITASPPTPVIETVRVVNPTTDPTKFMPVPPGERITYNDFPQPVTQPTRPYVETKSRQQPLLLFVGILLVIVLIVGGVLIGLQINKGNIGTGISTGTSGTTGTTTTITTPTHSTTALTVTTTHLNATTTPITQQPTLSPTVPPATSIPKGTLLYQAISPGAPCDTGGGLWADYNSPIIQCKGTSTLINNPYNDPPDLVGTFLTGRSGGGLFPASNYIVEAQLQQTASPGADFGIYFRNQPGNLNGVYTFVIHPDGTWSVYVYSNDKTAPRIEIAHRTFGNASAPVTIDVVVNGSNFTFYANGQELDSITDYTYPTGTAGIAVDAGGTVTASNFTLYEIA